MIWPLFEGETKLLWKSTPKRNYVQSDVQIVLIFDILNIYKKEISKRPQVFVVQKHIKLSILKVP